MHTVDPLRAYVLSDPIYTCRCCAADTSCYTVNATGTSALYAEPQAIATIQNQHARNVTGCNCTASQATSVDGRVVLYPRYFHNKTRYQLQLG